MYTSLKISKKRKLTIRLEHNTRKTFEKRFPCNNREAIKLHPLQAAKFPLNPALRRFTDGPYKFQVSESYTELHRNNEHTCESIQYIIKEVNRK
jgi:hypothetical protein